jgi:proline iminopeptidase
MEMNGNLRLNKAMPSPHLPALLYPPLEPHKSGYLKVNTLHTLYWEECGNPSGIPVVVLHGGPGAGCSPAHRQFFDPEAYRIVLFDQRGAGRSTPLGAVQDNTTQDLVADIEQLKQLLGIAQWLVFGGSWGSTLALAYGQAHPSHCLGFVLRGIFLCTPAEVSWFLQGMGWFFPEAYARFVDLIPDDERHDLLSAYEKRLFNPDPAVTIKAAKTWSHYEGSCLHLLPQPEVANAFESDGVALGLARLEAHYFRHGAFLAPDQLLRNMAIMHHLPAVIVQGRYDVVCPPLSAHRLHQAWPQSVMHTIEDAGHSAFEPGITKALVTATNQFAARQCFDSLG